MVNYNKIIESGAVDKLQEEAYDELEWKIWLKEKRKIHGLEDYTDKEVQEFIRKRLKKRKEEKKDKELLESEKEYFSKPENVPKKWKPNKRGGKIKTKSKYSKGGGVRASKYKL